MLFFPLAPRWCALSCPPAATAPWPVLPWGFRCVLAALHSTQAPPRMGACTSARLAIHPRLPTEAFFKKQKTCQEIFCREKAPPCFGLWFLSPCRAFPAQKGKEHNGKCTGTAPLLSLAWHSCVHTQTRARTGHRAVSTSITGVNRPQRAQEFPKLHGGHGCNKTRVRQRARAVPCGAPSSRPCPRWVLHVTGRRGSQQTCAHKRGFVLFLLTTCKPPVV